MKEASGLFRLLGDDVRLRLLRLLTRERLNVGELTSVLGIAQSGVSRHIGLLRDAGLVRDERAGGFTYLSAEPDEQDPGLGPVWALLRSHFERTDGDDAVRGDEIRLREVLRRRRENADTHGAGQGAAVRQMVPGRSWAAWARGLGLLLPPWTVADLGCGEGYLTLELASWAEHVIGVDRSEQVLTRARSLAGDRGVENVEWRRGEIEELPVESGVADLAVLSQALHHAEDPSRALSEAVRILTPGGRLLLLDLRRHEEAWTRERFGDRWPGFAADELCEMMTAAGLDTVRVRPVTSADDGAPFVVVAAVGVRAKDTKEGHAGS